MARRGPRPGGASATATRAPGNSGGASGGRSGGRGGRGSAQARRQRDEIGLLPVLAKTVREVETTVNAGRVAEQTRTKYLAVALLAREERARVKTDPDLSEPQRADQLKRLDGIGTILAKCAARDATLYELLGEDVVVSDAAKAVRRDMLALAGAAPTPEPEADEDADPATDRRVVPVSVVRRQLANPFLPPDFSAPPPPKVDVQRLAGWELIGPLLSAFERASGGAPACMELPESGFGGLPTGLPLMRHQSQVVAAAAAGHRTFLLADEPGLGKTAQALLAAQAADAYPLLVVVPNVVKTNWAREAALWTPQHSATVVQGNGDDLDGFADIVIVNYEVLDRHAGWLGDLGFRGMVLDEAHFIKNKTSQRSQHVLQIADRLRQWSPRPLMMALTGTPLINDVEDFRAIWQFLGWIDEKRPRPALMAALEDSGLTPLDPGFYPAARSRVIDLGIVRRRKVDVAADIPARRIADIPVELDGEAGRSIRAAEHELARRLVARYRTALEHRGGNPDGPIDLDLVHQVAQWERDEANDSDENVFSMLRRIGQAKAVPAADYTAQLARNVGKVVFFAKHIDVMDAAEQTFAKAGLKYSSIRGNQTPSVRQQQVDAFVDDPEVSVVVCSLSAAGVGLNLHVASNIVLAELSWTDAEQTQAIDRVHRIGQDQPVTAWRIIAAQTIDTKIVELIDAKAGLAARALDGSDEEVVSSVDLQVEALAGLLREALGA